MEMLGIFTRRLMAVLLAVLVAAMPAALSAQEETPKARAILVLDASGSMWGQIDGQNKIVIARDVVKDLLGVWDPAVYLGLMAYGHRRKGDCSDIEMLVPVGPVDAARIAGIVDGINPKGKTPLSAAVRQAAETLKYTEEAATVILVTDGLETCDADPCAVAKSLEESGVDFTTHVVGFDLSDEESKQVQCLAENTGGQYFKAGNATELREALGTVAETVQRGAETDIIRVTLAEGQAPRDDIRFGFEYFSAEDAGKKERKYIAYGYGNAGRPSLPPGSYLAVVKAGSAIGEFPFEIDEAERHEHVVNLNAGRLTPKAKLDESSKETADGLAWEIFPFAADGHVSEQYLTYAYGPAPEFILPAGKYRVSVRKDAARAYADQTIEAGGDTELVIDLRAGKLAFDAVLKEGASQYDGRIGWEAYAVGDDGQRAPRDTAYSYGPGGTYTLTAGRYALKAKAGAIENWVEADVPAGETAEVTVDLNGGMLAFDAVFTEGADPAVARIGWEVFPVAEDGTVVSRYVSYSYGPAGEYLLPVGEYELKARADAIVRTVRASVAAGETTKSRVNLDGAPLKFRVVDRSGNQVNFRTGWEIRAVNDNGEVDSRYLTYGYSTSGESLLPAGAYEIQVKSDNYGGAKRFEIEAGKPISIDITVTPKS